MWCKFVDYFIGLISDNHFKYLDETGCCLITLVIFNLRAYTRIRLYCKSSPAQDEQHPYNDRSSFAKVTKYYLVNIYRWNAFK